MVVQGVFLNLLLCSLGLLVTKTSTEISTLLFIHDVFVLAIGYHRGEELMEV